MVAGRATKSDPTSQRRRSEMNSGMVVGTSIVVLADPIHYEREVHQGHKDKMTITLTLSDQPFFPSKQRLTLPQGTNWHFGQRLAEKVTSTELASFKGWSHCHQQFRWTKHRTVEIHCTQSREIIPAVEACCTHPDSDGWELVFLEWLAKACEKPSSLHGPSSGT